MRLSYSWENYVTILVAALFVLIGTLRLLLLLSLLVVLGCWFSGDRVGACG